MPACWAYRFTLTNEPLALATSEWFVDAGDIWQVVVDDVPPCPYAVEGFCGVHDC